MERVTAKSVRPLKASLLASAAILASTIVFQYIVGVETALFVPTVIITGIGLGAAYWAMKKMRWFLWPLITIAFFFLTTLTTQGHASHGTWATVSIVLAFVGAARKNLALSFMGLLLLLGSLVVHNVTWVLELQQGRVIHEFLTDVFAWTIILPAALVLNFYYFYNFKDGRPTFRDVVAFNRMPGELEENIRLLGKLTSMQLKTISVAQTLGYYSSPKKALIRDIAQVMGLSESTVAEHLRKAEARILSDLLRPPSRGSKRTAEPHNRV